MALFSKKLIKTARQSFHYVPWDARRHVLVGMVDDHAVLRPVAWGGDVVKYPYVHLNLEQTVALLKGEYRPCSHQ